jgi:hypothetical protein
MKIFSKAGSVLLLSLLLLFLSLEGPVSAGDKGLIPPSRTPEATEQTPGRLTVVSEPPGLEVLLDSSGIGQTPIWQKQVDPGSHTLWITQVETTIYVEPGKTTRISFFKGSFITAPEEEEAEKMPGRAQEEEALREDRGATLPSEAERPEDLTPWERFLNRTSPNF